MPDIWSLTNNCRTESQGENTAASTGTTITASVSANTKGSWTNLGSTTSFAYELISVCIAKSSAAADYTIDVGIVSGGNQFVLVADLRNGSVTHVGELGTVVLIPIHVPSGSQLAARCQSSAGSSGTVCVHVVGWSVGLGGMPGFNKCVCLSTISSSRGVSIDPGASANTKGSWTQLTASSSDRVVAFFAMIGDNGDSGLAATQTWLLDIGIGASGKEQAIAPNIGMNSGINLDERAPQFLGTWPCDVPSATRWAARAACSINTATDRTFDLTVYGLVP